MCRRALTLGEKEGIEKAYRSAQHPTEKVRYLAMKLLTQGYPRKAVSTILGRSLSEIGNRVTVSHYQRLETKDFIPS